MKKLLIIFSFLMIITIIWLCIYSRSSKFKIDDFSIKDINAKELNFNKLTGGKLALILINNEDPFSINYLKQLFPDILIPVVVIKDKIQIFGDCLKNGKIYYSEDAKLIDNLYIKYNLDKKLNYYFIIGNSGYIELIHELTPGNRTKLTYYTSRDTTFDRGNIDKLTKLIMEGYSSTKDSIILLTQKLTQSCVCYYNFQYIVDNYSPNKLKVILIGDWSEIDKYNFEKMQDGNITVANANKQINEAAKEWETKTKRDDFNAVLIGKCTKQLYPLLTLKDYEKWYSYRNINIIKKGN